MEANFFSSRILFRNFYGYLFLIDIAFEFEDMYFNGPVVGIGVNSRPVPDVEHPVYVFPSNETVTAYNPFIGDYVSNNRQLRC
jgi:hypothetical protein